MANLEIKDFNAAEKHLAATGAGSDVDPHIVIKEVVQDTHDDLNANVTIQVGDTDVAVGNPVPVAGVAAENAAAAGNPVLVGGRYDATPRTLGDGDVGAPALDPDGAVHIADGGNVITVDGTVTITPSGTQNVDVTANSIGLAAESGGNLDTLAGAVAAGQMQVDIVADGAGLALAANQLAAGHDVTVDNAAGANSVPVQGDAAENAAVTGNPVLVGGRYDVTPRTLGDGDVGAPALAADGAVHIDDGGNTITVDGTVTADAGTGPWPVTDNAGSLTVDAPLATPVNVQIGDGTDTALVDASGRLSVSIDAETASVTVDQATASNLKAQVDGTVAHDGADSGGGGPVKIGGRAQEPTTAPDEVADNDRVDRLHDRVGRAAVYGGYPRWFAAINHAGSGDNTILAAQGVGKIIVVTSLTVISDGTVDVRFESGAGGTALTGQMPFQAREGYTNNDPEGLFQTAANALLNMELSAAVNVHGHISGFVKDD